LGLEHIHEDLHETTRRADDARLPALSGLRNPCPGGQGVFEVDALAYPHQNLRVIMKDGQVFKNTL